MRSNARWALGALVCHLLLAATAEARPSSQVAGKGRRIARSEDTRPGPGRRKRSGMSRSKSAGGNEAYQSLVVLDGKFANSTTSLKSKYASGDSTKKTEIELNLNYLKRFGSLFAGPLIGYSSSSTSYGDDTSSSNTLDIGGLVDFPVADIDRAKTVPHVYAGARYNTELSGEDNKYSGYRFAVGAGAYFFLDRGIAIDLKFEFQKQLLKIDGDTGLEKDATNLIAGAGIAVFL